MPVSGVTCLQFHATCRAAAQAHVRSLLAAGGQRTRLTSPATASASASATATATAPKPRAASSLHSLLLLRGYSPPTHRFKNSTPCNCKRYCTSFTSSSVLPAHARTFSPPFAPSQPSTRHLNYFSQAHRPFRDLSEFHYSDFSRKASLRKLEPSYALLSTTPNSFLRPRFLPSSSSHRGLCSPPLTSAAMSTLSQPQTPAALDSPLREHRYRPVERLTDCLETPSLDDRKYRVVRLPNQLEVLLVHDAETDKASAAMDVNVGNFSDEEDMSGMVRATEDIMKQ
jgi:hypothetical protein